MRTRQIAKYIEEQIEELKEHIHQQFTASSKHFGEICEKLLEKFKFCAF